MDLKSQKEIASKILKCGKTRVKVTADKDVEEALTRNDIRDLIQRGLIKKIQKKGTSKAYSKQRLAQKKRGRKKSFGSRKGTMKARIKNDKKDWLAVVRPLRRLIKKLLDDERISRKDYTNLYRKIKGGFFRNKKHLLSYLKTQEMLKERTSTKKPAKKEVKIETKTKKEKPKEEPKKEKKVKAEKKAKTKKESDK
ncbi:MAG: 50S ribosomal protein L19e [Nanoarchaeota archaeon]|nr:50S ribosomal protein L19e [Nanoarchaeota archaeon]MBU1135088.1 50S ribosomal protein L19e [Nanoarchaeota archaeon]MBU2519989.1 50S ribosomal protein L19e [Nanoarchaeota archaeon]